MRVPRVVHPNVLPPEASRPWRAVPKFRTDSEAVPAHSPLEREGIDYTDRAVRNSSKSKIKPSLPLLLLRTSTIRQSDECFNRYLPRCLPLGHKARSPTLFQVLDTYKLLLLSTKR